MKKLFYPFLSIIFILMVFFSALVFMIDVVVSSALIALFYVLRNKEAKRTVQYHVSDVLMSLDNLLEDLAQ